MKTSRMVGRTGSFSAFFLACALPAAQAQPVSTSSACVEWRAAHSAMIVRGVIEDIAVHEKRDSIHRYQTVSVRVLETIKGQHSERLQFVQNGDFGPHALSKLRQDKQEVLLFLGHWALSQRFSQPSGGYAYARFPYVVESAVILTPEDVRFAESSVRPLTANLTRLVTPSELIGAVKEYLASRRDEQPVRGVTIELPPEMRWGYFRVQFTFPADANAGHPQAIVEKPVADFATIKRRLGKEAPAETKPRYTRNRRGYIGVYALEWMAADCDAIVRGVIEDSCFIAAKTDPTGPSCGMKMRVLETLKGKAPDHLNVYVTDARDLDRLQHDQQQIVVFLRNQALSGTAAVLGHQTRAGLWDDSVIVLHEDDAEVLFADLSWHHKAHEIIDRLRAVTAREDSERQASRGGSSQLVDGHVRPPVFRVHCPAPLSAGSSIAGNQYALIYLPVDRDLEANARKWAKADSKDLRWLAARGMIYFKSDTNAALLRTLLDDQATWSRRDMFRLIQPLDPKDNPVFLVRWEAWHVLDGWGYEVARPSFRASD